MDGADPGQGEHREDPLGAIEEPDRDLLARPDAGVDQPARGAIDLVGDLAKRVAAIAEDQRLAVAPPRGGLVGQVAEAPHRERVGSSTTPVATTESSPS